MYRLVSGVNICLPGNAPGHMFMRVYVYICTFRQLFQLRRHATRTTAMDNFHFIILSLVLPLYMVLPTASAQQRQNYCSNTCPNVESIVRGVITNKFQQIFVKPSAILRFFDDCFVQGRDASLAGDGFDTDIKAKAAVDSEPNYENKFSCADISAMAPRDVASLVRSLLFGQCSRFQRKAQTFANDNCGCIRGMGDRVSKTAIEYSDPYKKAIQKEQELHMILEAQLQKLEKRLAKEFRELSEDMDDILILLIFLLLHGVGIQMWSLTKRWIFRQVGQIVKSLMVDTEEQHTRRRRRR